MERGELSGVKVHDLVEHYVGSRAASTLGTYAAAYRRVVKHMMETGVSLFRWGRGDGYDVRAGEGRRGRK